MLNRIIFKGGISFIHYFYIVRQMAAGQKGSQISFSYNQSTGLKKFVVRRKHTNKILRLFLFFLMSLSKIVLF